MSYMKEDEIIAHMTERIVTYYVEKNIRICIFFSDDIKFYI